MLERNVNWYAENNVAVLAWECLAKGFMAGKWTHDDACRIKASEDMIKRGKKRALEPCGDNAAEWREMQLIKAYATEQNFKRRKRAEHMAAELRMSLPQISIRFVCSQPYPCFALIGTTSLKHLKENVDGARPPQFCAAEVDWLKTGKMPAASKNANAAVRSLAITRPRRNSLSSSFDESHRSIA